MAMKNPPHPGDFIRTEIIQPAGLSVTEAAKALRVSCPALSSLLNGKADLSGDMALRTEKAFGLKMYTLMRMQSASDIAKTRKREKEIRVPRFYPTADFIRNLSAEQSPLKNSVDQLRPIGSHDKIVRSASLRLVPNPSSDVYSFVRLANLCAQ